MPQIRRSAYLLTVVLLAFFGLSLVWRPDPPPHYNGITSAAVPTQFGAWVSKGDYPQSDEVLLALAAADIISRTYASPLSPLEADFVLIGGTDRTALHDPRGCLMHGGWSLENDHVEHLDRSGVDAHACQAIDGPGGTSYDIVYLYDVDGNIRNRVSEIRGEMLLSAVLGRQNRPVYFLRVMMPLARDPASRVANHKDLVAFADSAWLALAPRLGKH